MWELFVQAGPVGMSFLFDYFNLVHFHFIFFKKLVHGFSYFECIFAVNVYVPKDRVTNLHQGYGFVEFRSEEDADYVNILQV